MMLLNDRALLHIRVVLFVKYHHGSVSNLRDVPVDVSVDNENSRVTDMLSPALRVAWIT